MCTGWHYAERSGKKRQCCKQWNHRQILKQQNRKTLAAVARGELFFFGQRLQHKGGRRHRQSQPGHQRCLPAPAMCEHNEAQRSASEQHLRGTEAKHLFAQHPQARWLQFKTDDEEQQDDAKLRCMQDRFNVVNQFEAPRADQHAGGEVTQDGAKPEPFR